MNASEIGMATVGVQTRCETERKKQKQAIHPTSGMNCSIYSEEFDTKTNPSTSGTRRKETDT